MSLDTSIAILKTTDEYRVEVVHAIDNLFVFPQFIVPTFSNSQVFQTYEETMKYVNALFRIRHIEHGYTIIEKDKSWRELVR